MSSCQSLVANFRSQDRKQLRYCVLWDADNCAFTASNMEAIQAALHPARLTSTDVFASGCTARHLLEPAVGEARPAGVSAATQAPRTSLHRQLPSLLLVCATWLRVLRLRNTILLQQLFTRSSVAITDTFTSNFNCQLLSGRPWPRKRLKSICAHIAYVLCTLQLDQNVLVHADGVLHADISSTQNPQALTDPRLTLFAIKEADSLSN